MSSYVCHPLSSPVFWTQTWDMCFNENRWMWRNEGRGCLNWAVLLKSEVYGHFSCVAQQSAGLKADTQKLFPHGSELQPNLCQVPSLRQLCEFSDYIIVIAIISSIQLIFWWVLKFVATFLFSFSTCPQLCLSFLKGLGKWINPTILLFIKFHGQERIYQKCKVGGGGGLIKLDSVWFSILLPLTAHS